MTRACLSAMQASNYPREQLDIVVVDNASHDGSLEHIRAQFPDIEIISNATNLGFAEACNIGMRNRDHVDYVALVNNDAIVDRNWLQPLVDALEANPQTGAAAPLLLLDPPTIKVNIDTSAPMQIHGIELDGVDITNRVQYVDVSEVGDPAWPFRMTRSFEGPATLYLPAPHVAPGQSQPMVTFRLDGDGQLRVDSESMHLDIRCQGSTRVMFAAPPERHELVNGLGTVLNDVGEAADLGYGEEAQNFQAQAALNSHVEIGVCGGGVLFRSKMLDRIGLFDPKLFAYYEDIDLSWRARRDGWEIVAVPDSVIRHQFGGSAGSTSPMFFHLYYRNWLTTVLKNADWPMMRRAATLFAQRYWWAVKYNMLSAVRHPQRWSVRLPLAWTKVLIGVLVLAPRTLMQRLFKRIGRRIGRRSTNKVYSLAQPLSSSRPPQQRIGGPELVHVVLDARTEISELDPDDRELIIETLRNPAVDLVVVQQVEHRTDTFKLLTPLQWAELLDVTNPSQLVTRDDDRRFMTGLQAGQRPLRLDELRTRYQVVTQS